MSGLVHCGGGVKKNWGRLGKMGEWVQDQWVKMWMGKRRGGGGGFSWFISFSLSFWPVQHSLFLSLSPRVALPGWGGRQDLGQEGHAIHRPHGDVERPGHVHGHGGRYRHRVGDVHRRRGRDVDRGDVDGPGDGDRVLEAHWGCDVDRVGANVHLCGDGDRVVVVVVVAPVHRRGDGGGGAHRRG